MDIRYFKYINSATPFYAKSDSFSKESDFDILNVPSHFQLLKEKHWTYVMNINDTLPQQGWKLHISSTMASASKTLEIVSALLLNMGISFKYVTNLKELMSKHSKYSDRSASGKFITIYPLNESVFTELLEVLADALKTLPKGPYILTDKRWRESNVFFRYGAFQEMYFYEGSKKVHAIRTPTGQFIEDSRAPQYNVPSFVQEPIKVQEMSNHLRSVRAETTPLEELDILKPIHFSNGGGVYLAADRNENKVILKEGRPDTGLDGIGVDAYQRIKNEADVLFKLQKASFPVKIYDYFQAWEHNFIVEEFIEGESLSTWLAKTYPFYSHAPNEDYVKSTVNILEQLIIAVKEIHRYGVGMGDLHPSNIIITKEDNLRLIDFETASLIDGGLPSGLRTFGFTGDPSMNREQADWYAVWRIARFMFLPIGPVQDISSSVIKKHDQFILETFGPEAEKIIGKIHEICRNVNALSSKELINLEPSWNNPSLEKMKMLLKNNIIDNLFKDSRVSPGDIRQFELNSGYHNILTGAYGTVFALNRSGELPNVLKTWIENQHIEPILQLESGLFTGKAGIVTALLESDYSQKAMQIIDSIQYEDSVDISLSSGLSGIGLMFIGLSYEPDAEYFLKDAIEIGDRLENLLNQNISPTPYDVDLIPRGLLNGWSGVSLFYSALFKKTRNMKWLNLSKLAIEKDLNQCVFDKDGVYQLNDTFRVVPYLDGGSAGVGVALIELSILLEEDLWAKELEGIYINTQAKCFYNAGLFKGTAGIIAATSAIDKYYDREKNREIWDTLKLHLLIGNDALYTPGDYGYRLSNDLFSGALGLLLIIEDTLNDTNFSWLPIPNNEEVFPSNVGSPFFNKARKP